MTPAKIIMLSVAALALAVPARAQVPAINMAPQDKQYTSEELEKQREIDRAYKEAIKKLPDQQRSNDPWGNIRSVEQPAQKPTPKATTRAAPKNAGVKPQAVR